jgi:hypothetical protein
LQFSCILGSIRGGQDEIQMVPGQGIIMTPMKYLSVALLKVRSPLLEECSSVASEEAKPA